jgi:hypothetical protein
MAAVKSPEVSSTATSSPLWLLCKDGQPWNSSATERASVDRAVREITFTLAAEARAASVEWDPRATVEQKDAVWQAAAEA